VEDLHLTINLEEGEKHMRELDVLDFRGSYYEIGLANGRKLFKSKHFQRMLSNIKENSILKQDTKEIRSVLKYFCPQLLDELKGLQEGIGYRENDVLRLFGGYDMPILEMGCTCFITSDYYV